jgi:hypothetical protein
MKIITFPLPWFEREGGAYRMVSGNLKKSGGAKSTVTNVRYGTDGHHLRGYVDPAMAKKKVGQPLSSNISGLSR